MKKSNNVRIKEVIIVYLSSLKSICVGKAAHANIKKY